MSCYNNPCNYRSNCEHKNDCDVFKFDWVPHTSGTLNFTDGTNSASFDLCPGVKNCQTVTHLDFNTQTGCIEFQNEKYIYTDGAEGSLERVCVSDFLPFLNLNDLNDVDFDDQLDGNCYELIYTRDISCGDNCKSKNDRWYNFNINTPGAKVDGMPFVRGAEPEGCPVYLDTPETLNEYWFAGWRPNEEFGYFQPEEVDTLPTNENGDVIVMSQDPTTKKPIIGGLPMEKYFKNLMGNFAMEITAKLDVVQETPGFTGWVNTVTGDFTINWQSWQSSTTLLGNGVVSGKVNWDAKFNFETGNMEYHILSLDYHYAKWDMVQPQTGSTPSYFTLKAVVLPTGEEIMLIDHVPHDQKSSWRIDINRNIPCDQTIIVGPSSSSGPFSFAYIWTDWVGDDEGYMQLTFKNKLVGWELE